MNVQRDTGAGDVAPSPEALRRLRHELRTPVNHLVGYAELLLEDAENEESDWADQLRRIHATGRSLLVPIDDLVAAIRDGGDFADVVSRIDPLLAALDGACNQLVAEARKRDATDDLAVIHAAVVQLRELVDRPHEQRGLGESERSAVEMPSTAAIESVGSILVVDDNPQNRDMLARRLVRLGHTVEVAPGGPEALAMLGDREFDVLLLDVMMPEVDGFEVLAHLKADPALRELPVIMLSALDEVSAAVRCIELGADDYLTKPVETVLLRARIGACLERKRLRDTEVAYLRQAALVTGPAIIAQALVGAPLRTGPDRDENELRAAVLREATMVHLAKGETLFRAGDPGGDMYIVLSGRLRIDEPDERGQLRPRGETRRGTTIGELDMLTGQPRAVTATAVRDAHLARIPRQGFERLAAAYPRVLTQTTRDVIDRLREAFQARPMTASVTVFALVPVGRNVPAAGTAQRFANALAARGSTLLLDRHRLPSLLGHETARWLEEDSRSEQFASQLNELELRYRYVVYRADAEASPWTRRCLRQADHVLLLGQGQPEDDSGTLAREIAANARAAPVDLLLLREGSTARPTGTSEWLTRWPTRLHHHLRENDDITLARLARRLTGRSVDLVLGGGGARGWAHVGVLRAIEESGLPVDAVGGTSMGALIGGLAALDVGWQDIQEHGREWSSPRRLFDYTLPVVSIIAGGKMTAMLQTLFGEAHIEDLWRGFLCVSSSLTRAQPVVHRQGLLWRAVRASISMPGFLPPVHEARELLIDGAYLNNLPTDLMRETFGGGSVVAVSVNEEVEMGGEMEMDPVVSGWDVFWRRLVPWAPKVPAPGFGATIMRAASLSSAYHLDASAQLADLLILPEVGRFGTLDFSAYQQIIDAGYDSASRQIERWQLTRELAASPRTYSD